MADLAHREGEAQRLRRRLEWLKVTAPRLQYALCLAGTLLLVGALVWLRLPAPSATHAAFDSGDRLRPWIMAGCLVLLSGSLIHVYARRAEEALRRRAADLGVELVS